jgi:hypothetical protein
VTTNQDLCKVDKGENIPHVKNEDYPIHDVTFFKDLAVKIVYNLCLDLNCKTTNALPQVVEFKFNKSKDDWYA